MSHFAPPRLTHLNYSATILHFITHFETRCYTYNTLLHYKQNIHLTYTDLIRGIKDNINVTEK